MSRDVLEVCPLLGTHFFSVSRHWDLGVCLAAKQFHWAENCWPLGKDMTPMAIAVRPVKTWS